jgi:hypothetical protein
MYFKDIPPTTTSQQQLQGSNQQRVCQALGCMPAVSIKPQQLQR